MVRIRFEDLHTSDLIVDAIYEGGTSGNVGDDPIAPLLGVGNMGGFRIVGSPIPEGCRLLGLFTTKAQQSWLDQYDEESAILTYFGDNRTPGTGLLDTQKGGNQLLQYMFGCSSGPRSQRSKVPPVLVFEQVPESGRDVRFVGLAVPGVPPGFNVKELEVVTHGEGDEGRVINYQAKFTVLDAPIVSRKWIESLQEGEADVDLAPRAWREWVDEGVYRARGESSDGVESAKVRFMIPSGGPEGWRALLAEPELHWKKGRSARTMAHAWESANGWPHEVDVALKEVPALSGFRPVLGLPELKTPLPGGSRASQTDLMMLASDGHRAMTMGVEGKVDESLGEYVEDWLGEDPSPGKRHRLGYLAEILGVAESELMDVRYQLVHRSAAAKIETERFGADVSSMIVHVWSDVEDGFNDFTVFADRLGEDAEIGRLHYSARSDLWIGWIRGDDGYLEY